MTRDELKAEAKGKTNEELTGEFCELWFEEYTEDDGGDCPWVEMDEEEFEITLKVMGWADSAEFTMDTGCDFSDVEGAKWVVCGNPSRVFICQ